MKKVAIIGIQGVPARYGGFETLVENIIGDNCSKGVKYTVFCSAKDMPKRMEHYKGCKLEYLPLSANGWQSMIYDAWAMCRAMRHHDVLLVLGVSGCWALPWVKCCSTVKTLVNIDGLEHRRKKWGSMARRLLKCLEGMAVKWADGVIADNRAIEEYVWTEYGRRAEMIAYGGDHVLRKVSAEHEAEVMAKYGVRSDNFALSICRIEPENNCHLTLEAFAKCGVKLLFVGNWRKNHYGVELREKYAECENIVFVDALYDLDELYVLRANAGWYVHGHSAGGTNPSLVEAMFFGKPILAYDVVYNRETTENRALYFKTSDDICRLLECDVEVSELRDIAERRYRWKTIAGEYERMY